MNAEMPDSLARHRCVDRDFGSVVKLLPNEYYVTTGPKVLLTVLGSCVAACLIDPYAAVAGIEPPQLLIVAGLPSHPGADHNASPVREPIAHWIQLRLRQRLTRCHQSEHRCSIEHGKSLRLEVQRRIEITHLTGDGLLHNPGKAAEGANAGDASCHRLPDPRCIEPQTADAAQSRDDHAPQGLLPRLRRERLRWIL